MKDLRNIVEKDEGMSGKKRERKTKRRQMLRKLTKVMDVVKRLHRGLWVSTVMLDSEMWTWNRQPRSQMRVSVEEIEECKRNSTERQIKNK